MTHLLIDMSLVRLLQRLDLLARKAQAERCDRFRQVVRLGGPTMGADTTGFFSTQASAT
jgi:hypothetical protein